MELNFFVDSNLSVPPASEIIIKRRKHSQRRRPERGRTCDHILTWHSYTTHTHTQTQKHALTQVRVCQSRSMMHQVSASFIISLLTRYRWGCVLIVTFYLFTFCCLFFQFFLVVSKFQVLKPRAKTDTDVADRERKQKKTSQNRKKVFSLYLNNFHLRIRTK